MGRKRDKQTDKQSQRSKEKVFQMVIIIKKKCAQSRQFTKIYMRNKVLLSIEVSELARDDVLGRASRRPPLIPVKDVNSNSFIKLRSLQYLKMMNSSKFLLRTYVTMHIHTIQPKLSREQSLKHLLQNSKYLDEAHRRSILRANMS